MAFGPIAAVKKRLLAENVADGFLHFDRNWVGWNLHNLDRPARSSDHGLVVADDRVGGNQMGEAFEKLTRKRFLACERPGVVDKLERWPNIALRERVHPSTIRQ
jgi:hypothetical protein